MRQEIPSRLTALVSECFPGWTVEECIGSGSYSKVYRIRQSNKDAVYDEALKWVEYSRDSQGIAQILERGASDKDVAEYLSLAKSQVQREIQLMDRLRGNSYIVNMNDHQIVDREDGGFDLLIRMEYLTPLRELTGEMTVQDAAQVGMDICSALIDCEKEGIAHRDIKPANIFRNRQGRYKLGDFGVAKQIDTQRESMPQGTPLYMAPEVYQSKPYDGKKADTYSLGLVLYELLNAQHPPFTPLYNCPPTVEQEEESVRLRVSGKDLPSPLQGTSGLNMIILRACSFDEEDRYDSAAEMLEELQALDLNDAAREKLKGYADLPAPPQPAEQAPAGSRDPRQDNKLTEKSSPSDTNPLAAGPSGSPEGGGKRKRPAPSAEEEEEDVPVQKKPENSFSVQGVINENERERQEKLRKRKKRIAVLTASAVVLLAAAVLILILMLQSRMSGLTFVQNGTKATVTWEGGPSPCQVTVLKNNKVLRQEQVRDRTFTADLAPGYEYTIQVADQSVAAPMKELPNYEGTEIALQLASVQYYLVKSDGMGSDPRDTDQIVYSPLLGTVGERSYMLHLAYKMPAREETQAVCFLIADSFQDQLPVVFTTSRFMKGADTSLNETVATQCAAVNELIYKVYVDDALFAQGSCSILHE